MHLRYILYLEIWRKICVKTCYMLIKFVKVHVTSMHFFILSLYTKTVELKCTNKQKYTLLYDVWFHTLNVKLWIIYSPTESTNCTDWRLNMTSLSDNPPPPPEFGNKNSRKITDSYRTFVLTNTLQRRAF